MSPQRHLKVSIGFAGGQLLAVRATAEALATLSSALGGDQRWIELELDDGSVQVDLSQVAYVRVDSDEPRVGFGA
jgi:hypothetical protein